jgi:hypothetical protein
MSRAKHRFRALVASLLAACALGSFAAATAQAAPIFYREGAGIGEAGLGMTGEGTSLAFLVPSLFITITCKAESHELTIKNLGIKVGVSSGKIIFTECETPEIPICTVNPFEFKVKGQLFAHASEVYQLFEPLENGVFGKIKILGAECTLPKEAEVKGVIVASMEAGEEVSRSMYFAEGIQTLSCKVFTPCSLKYGAQTAFLDGISTQRLTIPYATKKWSVL